MYNATPNDIENLTNILEEERAVKLPRGDYDFSNPIILPDEVSLETNEGWNMDKNASVLIGENAGLTRLNYKGPGVAIRTYKNSENKAGARSHIRISDFSLRGNRFSEGAINLENPRCCTIQRMLIEGFQNGYGIYLNGVGLPGAWYNKIERVFFGGWNTDGFKSKWMKEGIILSGNEDAIGKTNENTIRQCEFWNCRRFAIAQTGENTNGDPLPDPNQVGVKGGSAYNRIYDCTFYAEQALWAGEKPRAIIHDSPFGIHLGGNYIEKVWHPVYQTLKVDDNRFYWMGGVIKSSGVWEGGQGGTVTEPRFFMSEHPKFKSSVILDTSGEFPDVYQNVSGMVNLRDNW